MKDDRSLPKNSEVLKMLKKWLDVRCTKKRVVLCNRFWIVVILSLFSFQYAQAKSSYVSLIPNGNVLSCNACHTSSFSLNAFARDFKSNGFRWNAALAQKDSDGDGALNGLELQDPSGTWMNGAASPGTASAVTNPGDSSSVPAPSAPTATNTPTPIVIPPTHTPTSPVNTPTLSVPDSTPTPTSPESQQTPVEGDVVAGVWTGQSIDGDETMDWRLVLGNGMVSGTVIHTSPFKHDDDDEWDDDDEEEWEDDGERDDGDDEFEVNVTEYSIEGVYSLRKEGNDRFIDMSLFVSNDMELDAGEIAGIVDLSKNIMTLHGFDTVDAVVLKRNGDAPHPEDPTATPTVTPKPDERSTPTPVHSEPYLVHRFAFDAEDEYSVIPGGYDETNPAEVRLGPIPFEGGYHSDGYGVTIVAKPGEVGLLQLQSVEVEDSLVLVRVSVMTDEEGASVALAGLDGSMDGSIAMTMAMKSDDYKEGYHRMVLVYDPPHDVVVPVVQLSNPIRNDESVTLYVDNVEVYTIPKLGYSSNLLLNGM